MWVTEAETQIIQEAGDIVMCAGLLVLRTGGARGEKHKLLKNCSMTRRGVPNNLRWQGRPEKRNRDRGVNPSSLLLLLLLVSVVPGSGRARAPRGGTRRITTRAQVHGWTIHRVLQIETITTCPPFFHIRKYGSVYQLGFRTSGTWYGGTTHPVGTTVPEIGGLVPKVPHLQT